ncbi:MAG: SDR family oxidoreductase [Pseudomonadota bacterium]
MDKKKIVITGVTRGLGRVMADALIAQGHAIAGSGRSESQISDLQSVHPAHHFSVVDITDYQAVEAWKDTVLSELGVPDLVINNAGVINANAPLWEVPEDEFSHVIDVNVKGVYHVIRQFCPAMINNGGGVIVNFSSTWGRSVSADVAPYCASKFAVEGLTKAFAEDLPPSMVTVALNPGVIHTQMLESCFGDGASQCIKPDDWVKAAVPVILGITTKDNGASLSV